MTTIGQIQLLGFTRVEDFQRAWNLGPALTVDGIVGSKTTAAVKVSNERRIDGEATISLSYSARQFSCHCGGKLPGCHLTLIYRGLLQSLEEVNRLHKTTMGVEDGYRCPGHNAAVGGAKESQHLYGLACDPITNLVLADMTKLKTFSGIGAKESGLHRVTHVDRRDLSAAHNVTHGERNHPTVWYYPG